MGIAYSQTGTDPTHETQACSSDTLVSSGNLAKCQIEDGGTSGSTDSLKVPGLGRRSVIIYETPAVNVVNWAAGDYTIRVNVTTASTFLSIKRCYVCRVDSSGVNQATVGSDLTLNISLGTTGVKTMTISGSAQTAALTDRLYIVISIQNGDFGDRTATVTHDQDIDTPIEAATIFTPSPVTVPAVVPTPTLVAAATPDPVGAPLAIPTPTLITTAGPDPVSLPIVVPAPTAIATVKPDPVAAPIVVPAPAVAVAATPDPVQMPILVPALVGTGVSVLDYERITRGAHRGVFRGAS